MVGVLRRLFFYAIQVKREPLLLLLTVALVVIPGFSQRTGPHSFPDTRYFSESASSELVLWIQAVLVLLLARRVWVISRPAILESSPPPRSRLASVLQATAGLILPLLLVSLAIVVALMPGSPMVALQVWLWRWLPDFLLLGLVVVWGVSLIPGLFAPLAALLLWTGWLGGLPTLWGGATGLGPGLFFFPPYKMFFTPSWNPANILWRLSGEWLVFWLLFSAGLCLLPSASQGLRRRRFSPALVTGLLLIGSAIPGISLLDPRSTSLNPVFPPPIWRSQDEVPEWAKARSRHFRFWRIEYRWNERTRFPEVRLDLQLEESQMPFFLWVPEEARNVRTTGCEEFLFPYKWRCGGPDGSEPVTVKYEMPRRRFSLAAAYPCGRLALLYDLGDFSVPWIPKYETRPGIRTYPIGSRWEKLEVRFPDRLKPGCRLLGNAFRSSETGERVCSVIQERGEPHLKCDFVYTDCYTIPVIDEPGLSLYTVPAHARYINERKWKAVVGAWQDTLRKEGLTPRPQNFIETPYGETSTFFFMEEGFFHIFDHDGLSRLNALPATALAYEFSRRLMGNSENSYLRVRTGDRFDTVMQEYLAEVRRRAGD